MTEQIKIINHRQILLNYGLLMLLIIVLAHPMADLMYERSKEHIEWL